jgi:uncharacterized protein (DUF1800 family)
MLGQQQTFRRYGAGDTARWSGRCCATRRSSCGSTGSATPARRPNENLARELMELFTLGVGQYTEDDVKAGARVLTGWRWTGGRARAAGRPRHDDPR